MKPEKKQVVAKRRILLPKPDTSQSTASTASILSTTTNDSNISRQTGLGSDPKLDTDARRRERNRISQRLSRARKEQRLAALKKDVDKVHSSISVIKRALSRADNLPSSPTTVHDWSALLHESPAVPHPLPPFGMPSPPDDTNPVNANMLTLELIEAFQRQVISIIQDVCAGHLDTIHRVVQEYDRNHPEVLPAVTSYEEITNTLAVVPLPHQHQHHHPQSHPLSFSLTTEPLLTEVNLDLFNFDLPIVTGAPGGGPLFVPYFEPPHPQRTELTAEQVWQSILHTVNLNAADLSALTARLVAKVKCYGYEPLIDITDVQEVLSTEPLLQVKI
ncbi:hypothetical protein BZG36_01473 [Bifiguratus adelaidae]|uniref:BZIP domain-containing protein n=1 Tax=Bifiguratus adelaidae TaxID=1938954 RepID=A0A261Y4X5_9FUNG|nr:hypothetical protein BZG36_01473 [Bifiguratus adelaidae]